MSKSANLIQKQLRDTVENLEKALAAANEEAEAEKRQHKKVVQNLQAEAAGKHHTFSKTNFGQIKQ
jgi:vacuolar-type H+-ATPase subunit E/Vma4